MLYPRGKSVSTHSTGSRMGILEKWKYLAHAMNWTTIPWLAAHDFLLPNVIKILSIYPQTAIHFTGIYHPQSDSLKIALMMPLLSQSNVSSQWMFTKQSSSNLLITIKGRSKFFGKQIVTNFKTMYWMYYPQTCFSVLGSGGSNTTAENIHFKKMKLHCIFPFHCLVWSYLTVTKFSQSQQI